MIVIDLKLVMTELLSPTDLLRAQTFCIHKLIKVIVVGEYKDLSTTTFQLILSSFEDFNNN